jgi:hypothetical protein
MERRSCHAALYERSLLGLRAGSWKSGQFELTVRRRSGPPWQLAVMAGVQALWQSAALLGGPTAAFFGGARRRLEKAEQLADRVVPVPWMAERQLFVYLVSVAAPGADLR